MAWFWRSRRESSFLTAKEIAPIIALRNDDDASVRNLADGVIRKVPLAIEASRIDAQKRRRPPTVKITRGQRAQLDRAIASYIEERNPYSIRQVETIDQRLLPAASGQVIARLLEWMLEQAVVTGGIPGSLRGNDVIILLGRIDSVEFDYKKLLDLYERAENDWGVGLQVAWSARHGGVAPMVRALLKVIRTRPEKTAVALDLMHAAATLALSNDAPVFGAALAGPPEVSASTADDLGAEESRMAHEYGMNEEFEISRSYSYPASAPVSAPAPPPPAVPAPARPATAAKPDLPREFYGLAEAPSDVVVAEWFSLLIGITKDPPTPGAKPMPRPPSSVGEYTIVLTVQAPGFLFENDRSVFDLPVTFEDRWPVINVKMCADVQEDDKVERNVAIFFGISGQPVGSLQKVISTHTSANEETLHAQREVWRRVFSLPASSIAPDLTVMITDGGSGNLSWNLMTPHDVPVPKNPVVNSVGDKTKQFAETLVLQVNGRDGKEDLYDSLIGLGKKIAAAAPSLLWLTLKKIAAKHAAPSVLIVSNEPYIPWELAVLAPPLDPALPPFLGAQARVGRWIVSDHLPPPRALSIESAFAVSGVYDIARWNRLEHAEEEAASIRETYGAKAVDATMKDIEALLKRDPAPDWLHFSMHGNATDGSIQDGLITTDGSAISPFSVVGALADAPKSWRPFVFLNACQVAVGTRVLGDYSGIAAEFVRGGATAVIAPLWSIDDAVAKGIALEFYKATLTDGVLPAEAMRRARAKFRASPAPPSSAYLAYQYFGHPLLKLDGSKLHP